MATALGVGLLSGAAAAAETARARMAIVELDQLARRIARRAGPIDFALDREKLELIVSGDMLVARRPVASSVRVDLLDTEGEPVERVVYARDGRTRDFTVLLTCGNRQHRLSIAGGTGWAREVEP
jgi:hypothetical protein